MRTSLIREIGFIFSVVPTMGIAGLHACVRVCLHGVGDPGLVGLASFVFTLWGTQNKRNLPH